MNERPYSAHPEELLAGYVDGSLEKAAVPGVRSHLEGCAHCSREVELAGAARAALAALPDVDAPAVFIPETMAGRAPKAERRSSRAALVWTRGIAAAGVAAAVVVVAFSLLGGEAANRPQRDGFAADAPAAESTAAESGAESFASPPAFHSTDSDYDAASLDELARGLALPLAEGTRSTSTGSAPPATPTDVEAVDPVAGKVLMQAVSCLVQTAGLDPGTEPTYLERARFEGKPAFIGVFPRGPAGSPTHALVVVASTPDCSLLHVAQVAL